MRNERSLIQSTKVKDEKPEEIENIESTMTTHNHDDEITPSVKNISKKRPIKRKAQLVEVNDDTDEESNIKIKVVKHFLEDYGPQLNYAYKLWTKNSKILDKSTIIDDDLSENPLKWHVDDVCTFIVKFCDEETTAKFYAQKIDGEALLSLCQNDLVTLMNIKVGPAIKIYNRILHLRQEVMTKFADF